MTGGMVTVNSWFLIGAGGVAAFNQSGGTLAVTAGDFDMSCVANSTVCVANFSGSAVANLTNALMVGQNNGNYGNSVVNISGGAVVTTPTFQFGASSVTGMNGVLNLLGGTLATNEVYVPNAGTNNSYVMNFNGGTLKATGGGTLLTGLTSAYVQTSGGTINNNGNSVTVAQSLLAPSGSGVTTSGLSIGGSNSGYIDTPLVVISGGGGSGATAVATVSGSSVSGITITNPGVGYASSPTFTLVGGGGAATIGGSALLVSNTSGGMTFAGAGTTILTGTNSYTGPTTISAGVVEFTASVPPSGAGSFTINPGATLAATGQAPYNAVNGWLSSGLIATSSSGIMALTTSNTDTSINFGTPGYNNMTLGAMGAVTCAATINPGTNGFLLGPTAGNSLTLTKSLSGAANLAMNGAGTTILTATNTCTGTTTISAGTLQLGTGAAGYDGSLATSGVTDNSALVYNLAGNQTVSYSTSGSGFLAKAGAGTLVLASSNTYSGTTTVSAGTLQLGTGAAGHDGSINSTSGVTNNATLFYNLAGPQTIGYGINGTGAVTVTGGPLTFGGNVGGGQSVTLTGGSLTLAGANNNYTGTTNVNGGTLTISGYLNASGATGQVKVGDVANGVGLLVVSGTLAGNYTTSPSIDMGGGATTSVGAIRVVPGAVVTTASEFHLGSGPVSGTPGYGGMTMTGGSVTANNWFIVGGGGNASFNQSAGLLTVNNAPFVMGCWYNNAVTNVASFSGGAVANLNGSPGMYIGQNTPAFNGIVNVSGSAAVTAPNGVNLAAGNSQILNLNGGNPCHEFRVQGRRERHSELQRRHAQGHYGIHDIRERAELGLR